MAFAYRCFALCCVLVFSAASAESRPLHPVQAPAQVHAQGHAASAARSEPASAQIAAAVPAATSPRVLRPHELITQITLADLGFGNGFRLANLGERRDVFISLPEGADIAADELVLVFDDISAHEARRSLEILVNDRTAASIALDGHSTMRTVHVRLGDAKPQHGFLRFTFVYSGAATQDRCIDVRYVGDSLSVRPETEMAIDVDFPAALDIGTTTALLPRDVLLALPKRVLSPAEIATALTVARSLTDSGRQVTFQLGFDGLRVPPKPDAPHLWTRGLVLIGALDDVSNVIDAPLARLAGAMPTLGTLTAARVGGFPALVVSDIDSGRAARLFGSPQMSVTRGVSAASVGAFTTPDLPVDRVSFDQLGLQPTPVDVFGRTDLSVAIESLKLPPKTQPSRVLLDVMVAPDPAGEKAIVSSYVNDRLLASTVAASGEPTHLDMALPDGLVGMVANLRTVIQRRSELGDCRFEPQGYPAQILASSQVLLKSTIGSARVFADLAPRWADGVEVLIARDVMVHPEATVALLNGVLSALSKETAPLSVRFIEAGAAPVPHGAFLAVSRVAPLNVAPLVRFDQGRVAVADQSGHTLLDLGGFTGGAVAQVVVAGDDSGLWIHPLAEDGGLPVPAKLNLDRGNVAFIDGMGVALAMSTEREKVAHITYPDQISWMSIAEEFRPWITGGLWMLLTIVFLLVLQRMLRRRTNLMDR